jgi:hypothetical protein
LTIKWTGAGVNSLLNFAYSINNDGNLLQVCIFIEVLYFILFFGLKKIGPVPTEAAL